MDYWKSLFKPIGLSDQQCQAAAAVFPGDPDVQKKCRPVKFKVVNNRKPDLELQGAMARLISITEELKQDQDARQEQRRIERSLRGPGWYNVAEGPRELNGIGRKDGPTNWTDSFDQFTKIRPGNPNVYGGHDLRPGKTRI